MSHDTEDGNAGRSDEPKPVLWVSLTSAGRAETTAADLTEAGDRVKEAVGDDYEVIVADDRVRLATVEDLQDLRDSIDALLPSDLETEAERQERQREEMGLSAGDVMGGNTDAPGVQEPEGEDEA